jgi:hypothetical protein
MTLDEPLWFVKTIGTFAIESTRIIIKITIVNVRHAGMRRLGRTEAADCTNGGEGT